MATMRETKILGGNIVETKQEDRDGVPVGIIKGYLSTWDVDRGGWGGIKDQFVPGAFLKSIAEHATSGRKIRLKDHHGRTVGGFPITEVKEDTIGLYVVGEVNLEVQQGKELHSLARQGVLVDFSIGFQAMEDSIENGLRTITEAKIWEGSVVDEPMNPKAVVTEVKNDEGKATYHVEDVKKWTRRDIERALRDSNSFSKSATKALASRFEELPKVDEGVAGGDTEDYKSMVAEIQALSSSLKIR